MFVSMEVSTYIKDLLYRYECVILPGFGAFLTQYQPARIDRDQNFYPPSKSLSFNRQLQTNDGILANYVASLEGCSYELALQKIRNYTGTLSLQLLEGETVFLKNIGEFSLNKEKKVQFLPSEKENFNTAAFGLSSFVSPEIERQSQEDSHKVEPLPKEKDTASFPWMRYAAIGFLAITLGGFSGLKIYEGKVEKHNFAEKQKADSLVGNQIQEATFVIDNPLPAMTITLAKEEAGKYHIVAGAYRIEGNAQKKVQQLNEKGFSSRIIGVNKYGLHQVVYHSYQNRLEALQNLRKIKNSENKEAWLLVQELK